MAKLSSQFKYSRHNQGGITEVSGLGVKWHERKIVKPDPTDIIYYVENKYENRIDIIADQIYGDSRFWWVIAYNNNIIDPHQELFAGRMLYIPTKDRLFTEIIK